MLEFIIFVLSIHSLIHNFSRVFGGSVSVGRCASFVFGEQHAAE